MVVSKSRSSSGNKSQKLEARYTNYFEVGHNAFEFIFDFGQYHPEDAAARMHSRIVTGPVYAKLLATLLQDAVQRFETQNGTIPSVDDELDPLEMVNQSIASYDHRFNSLRKRTAPRSED